MFKQNIKLLVAYVGTSYVGWQKTWEKASIEQTLENVLCGILNHEVKLQAASRTDAGVHAEGQVVNLFLQKPFDLGKLKMALNARLPKDIAILSIEEMPLDFHPTIDNIKKEYWYHVCNSFSQLPMHRHTSWHFPLPLDVEAMRKGANHLIGRHDFSTFCNERKLWERDPVCHLENIEITKLHQERVRIALKGNRFLLRMARNIAGTLLYVGCGKLTTSAVPAILKSKDRKQAGVTAPAWGLTLKRVYYPA